MTNTNQLTDIFLYQKLIIALLKSISRDVNQVNLSIKNNL